MTAWMIVTSPENFALTAAREFTLQGIKARHKRKAECMAPGDGLVYYLTREGCFAAAAEITSAYFQSDERIWFAADKPDEMYPWRIETKPLLVLPEGLRIPAQLLKNKLAHVRKWPAAHWRLAFQGMVHKLPQTDWHIICATLKRAAATAAPTT